MANSIDQIAAINVAEMGAQKAQCVHAIAVLLLTAAMSDQQTQKMIVQCTGILAVELGIDCGKALEVVRAGASDLGMRL